MDEKTKKIRLGIFYGESIYIEVKENDNFDYVKAFQNWLGNEKRQAVQEYKDEIFLKKLDQVSKERRKIFGNMTSIFDLFQNK